MESARGLIDVCYERPMAGGLKGGIPAVFRLNQDGAWHSRCNTLMCGWHSAGPTGQPRHRKEDCGAGGKNWSNPPRGFFLSNCQYELTWRPANIMRGPLSVSKLLTEPLTCDNKGNRLLTVQNHSWSEEDGVAGGAGNLEASNPIRCNCTSETGIWDTSGWGPEIGPVYGLCGGHGEGLTSRTRWGRISWLV